MRSRGRTIERPEFQRVYRDTELNVLHSKRDCPMAKMAMKYHYLVNVTGTDHLSSKAQGLGWKACPKCGSELAITLGIRQTEAVKRR